MEIIAQLGYILGLSFISGINLYATVAVVGICTRFELIQGLPPEFQILANGGIIFVALMLYFVEFFMDKIQGLDTLWDSIHTIIRPLGGAMIALMQVGEASPALEVIVFMLGASLASAAHFTKAGTRLVINASPEPVSNILVSTGEDLGAVGFSFLTLAYPKLSFFLTLSCLAFIMFFLPLLFRTVRMLFASLFYRTKSLFTRGLTKGDVLLLPFSLDTFFDEQKEKDEEIVWAGKAYASRVPSIRRLSSMHLVITSKAVYGLYRRWFRLHVRRLVRSEIKHYKYYPGRLLSRCHIKTPEETWLVQLYQPLGKTLPDSLAPAGEIGS